MILLYFWTTKCSLGEHRRLSLCSVNCTDGFQLHLLPFRI